MANLNWYLKAPDNKGNRAIYTIIKYAKKPEGLKYYSGLTISPAAKWDGKKIKQGADYDKNDKLEKYRKAFDAAFSATYPDDPEPEVLKARLDDCKADIVTVPVNIKKQTGTFYDLFAEVASKLRKESTRNNYVAVMERLKVWRPDLNFKDINKKFLEEYRDWIRSENIAVKTTTVNAYLEIIKKVVKAAKKNIKENPFEEFIMETPDDGDKDAVALTKSELRILVDWQKPDGKPLPELTKALRKSLDCFLIGCFTGLRSQDLRSLSMKNVLNGNTLMVKTSKTGAFYKRKINPVVLRIIEKYKGFPKPLSSQQFNINIKEICRLAGLNDTGVLSTEAGKDLPLYRCVQSHTSRRTFVTIALYENKIPAATVMKWTLHKSESMLWVYARPRVRDSDIVAEEMDKEWD
jgi:integrase